MKGRQGRARLLLAFAGGAVMSKRKPPKRPSKPAPDDAVGYGSPPKAYQFKPGQSGNPKGRPKGSRNLATRVRALLRRRIPLMVGGRRTTMTARDVLLQGYLERGIRGDHKAGVLLLDLDDRSAPSASDDAEVANDSAADRAIMEGVIRRVKANMR